MAVAVRFPELRDEAWLRHRVEAGFTATEVARELGCSDVLAGKALRRLGLTTGPRVPHGTAPYAESTEGRNTYAESAEVFAQPDDREREPIRDFKPLSLELANLDADVGEDELRRRLAEGLHDLQVLVEVAAEIPRERLWGLVVDQVDAPTARACVFAAAAVASAQARRVHDEPRAGGVSQ